MADSKAKQRFVALRVNEVSLVDRPANEVEFLVIKRHPVNQESETNMATKSEQEKAAEKKAQEEAEAKKAADAATAQAEKAAVCKDCGKPAALCKCEKSAKKSDETDEATKKAAETELAEAEKALAEQAAKVEALKGKFPFAKKPKDGEEDPKDEKKAKKSDETAEAAAAAVEKSMAGDAKGMLCRMMLDDMHTRLYKMETLMGMDFDQLMSTAKAMGVATEKLAEVEKMSIVEKAVEKGKKQFSAERTEKFAAALKNLLEVAKDVSPEKLAEMLKAMLPSGEGLEKGGEANTKPALNAGATTPDAQGHSAVSAVKSEDIKKAMAEVIAPIAEKLEAVNKRVDEVASIRGVSKSLAADENETPVQKNDSLWTGVI